MTNFDINEELKISGGIFKEMGEELLHPDDLDLGDLVKIHSTLSMAAKTIGLIVSVKALMSMQDE